MNIACSIEIVIENSKLKMIKSSPRPCINHHLIRLMLPSLEILQDSDLAQILVLELPDAVSTLAL